MAKAAQPVNLESLNSTYEVQGELTDRKDARRLLAKRRADGTPVTISVFQAPQGDQGNAISHLAADVNRLIGVDHPNLVPILAGHWVGTDAFAIVSPRVDAPTLEELLSRREEDFSYARVAVVLREINGVIEWARAQKFVHRAVEMDTVYLDSGSDQLRVSFAVRALPRAAMPTIQDDARNVAALARSMLTRSPVAPEREEQPLSELRPGLPTSVRQETEALLAAPRNRGSGEAPDITGYISRLAMAEDLKRGEVHLEKSRNAIKEAHRKAKEEIEAAKKEHEAQLAAARAEHERNVAEQARKFAKERSDFEAELEKQRQALAREQEALAGARTAHGQASEALARERAAHKADCEVLANERAVHKKDAAALTAQLEEHRRLMADERKRLSAQVDSTQRQAAADRKQLIARVNEQQREAADERKRILTQLEELKRQTTEERKQAAALLAARLEEQKRVAEQEKQRIADQFAREKREAAEERKGLAAQFASVAATAPRSAPVPPKPPKSKLPKSPKPAPESLTGLFAAASRTHYDDPRPRARWNRSWNAPAAVAAVLVILAGITFAASEARDGQSESPPAAAVAAPVPPPSPMSSPAPGIVIDSFAGNVTPPVDSNPVTEIQRPRRRPRSEWMTEIPAPRDTAPVQVRTPSEYDIIGVSPIPLREGRARLDSFSTRPRDSVRRTIRRDSVVPIDTLLKDLFRPDSLTGP
jgi:hypothetical protein